MAREESVTAIFERRLIAELMCAIAAASSDDARQRRVCALVDLVRHCDTSLDATLLDPWTRAYLHSLGLTFPCEYHD